MANDYNEVPLSDQDLGNTGLQNFTGNTGKPVRLVFVPQGTYIATKTLALTKSTWVNQINAAIASRWFPTPKLIEGDTPPSTPKNKDYNYGLKESVGEENAVWSFIFEQLGIYNQNELAKFDGKAYDVFIVSDKNFIKGWESGDEFHPFETMSIRVTKASENAGDVNEHMKVELTFKDFKQFTQFQAAINPYTDTDTPVAPWIAEYELIRIKDIKFIVSGLGTGGFTLVAKGRGDGVAVTGLVKEDITITKGTDPALIALTSLTESLTVPGTYTAVWPTQTAGTFHFSMTQPEATTKGLATKSIADGTF